MFTQMSNAQSQEKSWADVDAIQVPLPDKQDCKSSDSCFTISSVRTPAIGTQDPGDDRERSNIKDKIHTQLFSNVYAPFISGICVTACLHQN